MVSIYQLHGELGALDYEINELLQRRKVIIKKIAMKETLLAMQERANLLSGIIKSISAIKSPVDSLAHVNNNRLSSWRHNLPLDYFENTIRAIGPSLPSNWTRAQAAEFFAALTKALEDDVASLETNCADA